MVGAVFGVLAARAWLTDLLGSLTGPDPTAFWYLSRSTAVVAYLLIWLSMLFGLLITTRLSRAWPGGPAAVDMHRFTALLGIGFGALHALLLLGDHYIGYGPVQLLVPFAGQSYRPVAVSLGQFGLYLGLVLSLSFFVRRRIGYRAWRLIHLGSFVFFFMSTLHGLTAGTDAAALLWMYVATTLVTLFLTVFRILTTATRPAPGISM
jgi:predicted ferric reductase